MTDLVDVASGALAVIVLALVRIVWRLAERVARLEGELENHPDRVTRRERRG